MPFLIFFTLILLLNSSCASTSADIKLEISTDYIEGKVFNDTEVKIFDGVELRNVRLSKKKFREAHGVSYGYYGVVFFTRDGFYPEAGVFGAGGRAAGMAEVSLNKLEDPRKGVMTGVVYKPVTGGKLIRHRGIFDIFRDEKIDIIKASVHHTIRTDDKGIFMIPLEKGEYNVIIDGKEAGKVIIEPGKTTIKNIQKGMVLMD